MEDETRSLRARSTLGQNQADDTASTVRETSRAQRIARQVASQASQINQPIPTGQPASATRITQPLGGAPATQPLGGGNTQDTAGIVSQVTRRPWIALGISVAAGYALGSLGGDDSSVSQSSFAFRSYTPQPQSPGSSFRSYAAQEDSQGFARYSSTSQPSRPASPASYASKPTFLNRPAGGGAPPRSSSSGFLDKITGPFGDEINSFTDSAASTLLGLVRDTIKEKVPALHHEVERVRSERGQTSGQASSNAGAMATPSDRPDPSEKALDDRSFGARTDM